MDGFSLIEDILNEVRQHGETEDSRMLPQTLRVMDGIPGGFFIYRKDGDKEILYANTALLRIMGCSNHEEFVKLTGGTFSGLVHPDDLEAAEKSISQQIGQGDSDYVVYRVRRRDGAVRWLEDYGHFVNSERYGSVFYVFVVDITEKMRQREQERKELIQENDRKDARIRAYDRQLNSISREHLRHRDVIEGLSVDYESIFYVDLDADRIQFYRVGHYSAGFFPPGEQERDYAGFVTEYINRWVHPEDRESFAKQMDPAVIREQLADCGEKPVHINFRRQDGAMVEYLQLRVVGVGSGGQVSQLLLGTRSMDEEIRAALEQQEFLSEALRQAQTAVEAKNAFLSNMSHDMRTPLNAIAGFTMLARKHADQPERVLRYLDMIEVSGRQLLRLIDNVLEIARIESGGEQLKLENCDLREIAQRVHSTLYAQAATKNLLLLLNLDGLKHSAVSGDARKMEEILYHLMSNAVKYTGQGGRVSLTVNELESTGPGFRRYQMIVEDNGIGIGAGFLQHLFESFAREKNTTSSGIFGTGLGLPIVKSIVEMMNGTIDVWSEPRRGSRFTVTLPLRPQEESGQRQPLSSAAQEGKLLVVEDNELNMEIARELLEDAGFEVETAENGRIGYERIRDSGRGEFALVLMDLQMPEMDGYQSAKAIRALPQPWLADLPIIALSANTFEEDRLKALDSGMNAHMAKPIEIGPLVDLICKLTGRPKAG